jgi:hypothetical protein
MYLPKTDFNYWGLDDFPDGFKCSPQDSLGDKNQLISSYPFWNFGIDICIIKGRLNMEL